MRCFFFVPKGNSEERIELQAPYDAGDIVEDMDIQVERGGKRENYKVYQIRRVIIVEGSSADLGKEIILV